MLYPLLFEPDMHTIVWGGNKLQAYKGIPCSNDPIGESWEVSAVPSSISIVSNGLYAGQNLNNVIKENPDKILGESVAKQYNNQLPLLLKLIDAKKDLSIQVHPDDKMAMRQHGKFGKTEMWYIIDAQPGSYLYAGFSKQIDKEEYYRRIADGTICDVLARHEVKSGDVFYLPAGRVHAICGGIMLAEVQQSSDVTYRIFDYNRPGMDGKMRELHTDLAAEALNYEVLAEYRTQYASEHNISNRIVESPYFSVRVTDLDRPFHRNLLKYDSFIITLCIEGDCLIKPRATGDGIVLREGNSCLIPAAIADYDVIPVHKKTRVLDAFIDNKDRSIGSKITRFLHVTEK